MKSHKLRSKLLDSKSKQQISFCYENNNKIAYLKFKPIKPILDQPNISIRTHQNCSIIVFEHHFFYCTYITYIIIYLISITYTISPITYTISTITYTISPITYTISPIGNTYQVYMLLNSFYISYALYILYYCICLHLFVAKLYILLYDS